MSHALYSPSRLPLLEKCAGFLSGPAGEAAKRGTAIDAVVTAIVSGNMVEIPEEYEEQVAFALQAVEDARFSLDPGAVLLPQERLETVIPGVYGTADLVIVNEFDRSGHVLDYKSGWSDRGAVERHLQLAAYAHGAALKYGLEDVHVSLVEMDRREVRRAHLDSAALALIPQRIADVIRRAKTATPDEWTPGKHCEWCVKSVTCPAFAGATSEALAVVSSGPADAKAIASEATPAQVGGWLTKHSDACEWVELAYGAMRARATAVLEAGGEVPGWQLVNGRKTRTWESDEEAEMALVSRLGDGAFTRKLRSPAQVEKIAKDDPDLKALVKSLSHAVPTRKLARAEESAA